MMRRLLVGICIFALVFNASFIFAQEDEETGDIKPVEENPVDEVITDVEQPADIDSSSTLTVEEESLSVPVTAVVRTDTLPVVKEEEFPKKGFKGTGMDVILAATSIIGWLFFMWLTANQRE